MTEKPAGDDAGTAHDDATAGGGTTTAPPPPPPPPHVPLVRPAHDRVFRGVCAAIGRATGTDPVLWRVLVVVLAFFGGTGLVLYLAGWLLIPEEGQAESEAQRLARGRGISTGGAVALVVVALAVVLAVLDDGRGVVPLLVLGVLAYLVLRRGGGRVATSPDQPTPATGAAAWDAPPAWTQPPAEGAGAPPWGPPPTAYGAPPPPPAPPRPRSNLGALTISAVALVVGALLLARSLGADGVDAPLVLAVALLVTGAGLLVGTRWGRARGLIVLAVVLGLALSATDNVDQRFGTASGDRTWTVDGTSRHTLGAGTATLDLRPLAGTERQVTVEARVGVGELVVLVPEDLRVAMDADVGFGELRTPDGDGGARTQTGPGLDRETALGETGRRNVTLDVEVGVGELEVRVVPAG
ncbi:MAG: PspC domain-containing protein [Actinomycetes bacterium]